MPEFNETETQMMQRVDQSNWYQLTLECSHQVYTRVRLRYEKPGRQYHNVQCPQCGANNKGKTGPVPLTWSQVDHVRAVNDEHVSHVQSGLAFILPGRIMRLDYGGGPNGNPFPYTSKDRDY